MNNNRRARLSICSSNLDILKVSAERIKDSINTLSDLKKELDFWSSYVNKIASSLEDIEKEEQDALDSIPESFQMGDIASSIEDALFSLSGAKEDTNALKDLIDKVEDTYIKSFLPGFNPENTLEELDNFIEGIEAAKENIAEAKE